MSAFGERANKSTGWSFLCLLTTMLSLVGCVSVTPMALNKQTTKLDLTSKSVVLLTLDISRQEESRFQPTPYSVFVTPAGAKTAKEIKSFKINKKEDMVSADGHSLYLLRLALEPGQHTLRDVFGMASAFPINCVIDVPLLLDYTPTAGAVAYAGRIKAIWRKRDGNEFRAGPVIPLIDQGICGASGGTFDIAISDEKETDIALFKQAFPVLNSATIISQPLPAFDRARAQTWWDSNGKDDSSTANSKN